MNRIWLIFCIVLGVVLAEITPIALAQDAGVELSAWNVEVWPEYDKPSVLVIAGGTLADDTVFPQTLRIPVPAEASINAVADVDDNGNLLEVPWRSEITERGQDVVFELQRPRFVVEFYADILSAVPDRRFDLSLVVPYAADQGTLSLRQPERASAMEIVPDLPQTGTDSLGNPMYSQQLGVLAAGQEISLRAAYTKPDAEPSVSAASEPPPSSAVPQGGDGQGDETVSWLPWLVVGLVVVLIGALVGYVVLQWRQRQAARSRQVRRREARAHGTTGDKKMSGTTADAGWQNVYCPRCGRKYDQADKFCRSCGTQRQ